MLGCPYLLTLQPADWLLQVFFDCFDTKHSSVIMFKWMKTSKHKHDKHSQNNNNNNNSGGDHSNNNNNQKNIKNNKNNKQEGKHQQPATASYNHQSNGAIESSQNSDGNDKNLDEQSKSDAGEAKPEPVGTEPPPGVGSEDGEVEGRQKQEENDYHEIPAVEGGKNAADFDDPRMSKMRLNSFHQQNSDSFIPPPAAMHGPPPPSQERLTAPGTCTLPRRAMARDTGAKVRSPSNPPPTNRQSFPAGRPQQPPPNVSAAINNFNSNQMTNRVSNQEGSMPPNNPVPNQQLLVNQPNQQYLLHNQQNQHIFGIPTDHHMLSLQPQPNLVPNHSNQYGFPNQSEQQMMHNQINHHSLHSQPIQANSVNQYMLHNQPNQYMLHNQINQNMFRNEPNHFSQQNVVPNQHFTQEQSNNSHNTNSRAVENSVTKVYQRPPQPKPEYFTRSNYGPDKLSNGQNVPTNIAPIERNQMLDVQNIVIPQQNNYNSGRYGEISTCGNQGLENHPTDMQNRSLLQTKQILSQNYQSIPYNMGSKPGTRPWTINFDSISTDSNQRCNQRDQDSGFDSLENSGPRSLNVMTQNAEMLGTLSPSKSTENLVQSNVSRQDVGHSIIGDHKPDYFRDIKRERHCSSPTSASQILPSDGMYPQVTGHNSIKQEFSQDAPVKTTHFNGTNANQPQILYNELVRNNAQLQENIIKSRMRNEEQYLSENHNQVNYPLSVKSGDRLISGRYGTSIENENDYRTQTIGGGFNTNMAGQPINTMNVFPSENERSFGEKVNYETGRSIVPVGRRDISPVKINHQIQTTVSNSPNKDKHRAQLVACTIEGEDLRPTLKLLENCSVTPQNFINEKNSRWVENSNLVPKVRNHDAESIIDQNGQLSEQFSRGARNGSCEVNSTTNKTVHNNSSISRAIRNKLSEDKLDHSNSLTVRDNPSSYYAKNKSYEAEAVKRQGSFRSQRDAVDGSEAVGNKTNEAQTESKPSSVSWMEWTQQLQAYVAWVNSQLKKNGLPIISDLRRDLQSGVVLADLIQIIAGEQVAGIQRDLTEHPQQVMRDNIDRVLQFMAAKRIKMAHITNKDVMEGNLKSIMRIILALAAHYKPQSVRCPQNNQTNVKNQNIQVGSSINTNNQRSPQKTFSQNEVKRENGNVTTSSSDTENKERRAEKIVSRVPIRQPTSTSDSSNPLAPDKTPNLSAHRRNLGLDICGTLRRQPSLSNTSGIPRPCSPVYENLPRRMGNGRWAYDSLRASHKFQWNPSARNLSSQNSSFLREGPQTSVDESSDDMAGTSPNTSCNTSIETDVDGTVNNGHVRQGNEANSVSETLARGRQVVRQSSTSSNEGKGSFTNNDPKESEDISTRPAALSFWQELQGSQRRQFEGNGGSRTGSVEPPTPPPCSDYSDSETPFRYHTIHRMSGRRKLPQIPSQGGSGRSSVTPHDTSTDGGNLNSPRGGPLIITEEASREPEGRSQNSSPATSVSRGPTLDGWAQKRQDTIKDVLMDLKSTREQLLALQSLSSVTPSLNSSTGFTRAPREEISLVRDAIGALRTNFRSTDPNQHILDTLEQAIAVLMEKNVSSAGSYKMEPPSVGAENKRLSISGSSEDYTKVIYFTERTVTPFMSTIAKALGDVTLRDFKIMFDRTGPFRYHFKNYDPEYGMVKEEITHDDHILPGVEGKITAWVQEDHD